MTARRWTFQNLWDRIATLAERQARLEQRVAPLLPPEKRPQPQLDRWGRHKTCGFCGLELPKKHKQGRPAKYCSRGCKLRALRERKKAAAPCV